MFPHWLNCFVAIALLLYAPTSVSTLICRFKYAQKIIIFCIRFLLEWLQAITHQIHGNFHSILGISTGFIHLYRNDKLFFVDILAKSRIFLTKTSSISNFSTKHAWNLVFFIISTICSLYFHSTSVIFIDSRSKSPLVTVSNTIPPGLFHGFFHRIHLDFLKNSP